MNKTSTSVELLISSVISYHNLFSARKLRPKTQSEARPDKVLLSMWRRNNNNNILFANVQNRKQQKL